MKRRKAAVGISIACLFIAAIAIQATFGGGIGLKIDPPKITVKPGSTIPYVITISSHDSDCFDISVIPYTCKKEWFEWTKKERVCVIAGSKKQISLNVTSTEEGVFQFKVKAESKSNLKTFATDLAQINVLPTPTPTPSLSPTPNQPPTCIGLMPNLSAPQKIMTLNGTKEIKWTAFACDPDEDTLFYRFCLIGPGTGYAERTVQEWSISNEWIWVANESDIGYSTIYADVRDGHHAPDYDDSCAYENYTIMPNQPPCCACLMPDKSEPQLNGTQINWTACAIDPEGEQDQLWYRFWLRGPETGDSWQSMTSWNTNNTWVWIPNEPGNYTIEVEIRDRYMPISFLDYRDVYAQYENYTITPGD
ncbi:MAG: hypothetical protein N2V78_04695 [Methanophagales archaeon]|nr:hypothetical protein [Methanophagales archaeon]